MRFGAALIGILLGLSAAEPARAIETPSANPAGSTRGSIHRLGPDAHQLRFEGESANRTWTIYVTPAQAATRARVHLAYSNAISVMPEVSTLAISVNDVAVAQTPIAAASDPGSVDVELPRGLLTAGYNSVRVSVKQRHRVDCSLEATYELWTQLDPASSGLTFPGLADPTIRSLDDLAAISPDPSGAVTIRGVLPEDASPEAIDRMLRAIEAVTIRARILRPNVEIVGTLDDRPGLWLVVGLQQELRLHGLGALAADSLGPTLVGDEIPGRTVVVVSGTDEKLLEESIRQILPERQNEYLIATTSAARALAGVNGFPIAGGTRVSLHDLGVLSEEFDGRLFRASFDVLLPSDFYPADYDKLTLSISAGYSAGLTSRAQILVRVNEKEAGSLPLRNPKGDLFRDRPVVVSLSALRPGVNRVVIEAQIPTEADAACDVRDLLAAKKRFVLFDSSELIMPSIARIARMPNLAVTMAGGFPYLGSPPGHLFLAKRDRATIAAAAAFLARTAFVAGRPLNLRTTFNPSDLKTGSAMLFGALESFDADLFERFGVDYAVLKEAWLRPDLAETSSDEALRPPSTSTTAEDVDLFDEWADGTHGEPADFGRRTSLRAVYDRFVNVHRNDFALFRDPDAKVDMPAKATLLIAQKRGPAGGADTWTLVVAANPAELTRDVRGLVAPSNWNMIEGRAAAFEPKSGAVNLAPAVDSYFIETATLTPANLRLVAAGWLSSNVDYYVIALAFGAVILGVLTTLTVRVHGNRQ